LVTLDIYVVSGCANCSYAAQVARAIAAVYPQVHVQVWDMAQTVAIPEAVFAAPTYVLNGRVVSLGNPDEETLGQWLEQALAKCPDQRVDTVP
jgi:hypothetical protein